MRLSGNTQLAGMTGVAAMGSAIRFVRDNYDLMGCVAVVSAIVAVFFREVQLHYQRMLVCLWVLQLGVLVAAFGAVMRRTDEDPMRHDVDRAVALVGLLVFVYLFLSMGA
jgi:hypothetical protein